MGLLHDWQYPADWLADNHERLSFSFWSADCFYPCSLPQMQSIRSSFRHRLEWLRVLLGFWYNVSALPCWSECSHFGHVMLEHGPCAGEMMSMGSEMVCSHFFTRSNTSSMTAKFIAWILHIALCILVATNSGSVILLLAQEIWEVFEIASQMKVGRVSSGSEFLDL